MEYEEKRTEIIHCIGKFLKTSLDGFKILVYFRERVRLPVLETQPTAMFNSEKWKHENYSLGSIAIQIIFYR